MFADARTVPEGTLLEGDICIMGAGAAGITLAREFLGQRHRILVFESGGLEYDADVQDLYDGEITGLPYFPLNSARLRFFGGTTNHWGGLCAPLREMDLERRAWIPHSGWPLTNAELAPFYERAQGVCQIPAPDWTLSNWVAKDRHAPLLLESSRVFNRFALRVPAPRLRFGDNYRKELEAAANVTVYLNSNVTEIEADEFATEASLVRLACLTGTRFAAKARAYVLALGGIENPRLLLLSTKAQPAGLGNGADLVGRFFLEHPRFDGGIWVPEDRRLDFEFYTTHFVAGSPLVGYISLTDEVLRQEEMVGVQARLDPVYDPAYTKALTSPELASLKEIVRGVQRRRSIDDLGTHLTNVLDDLASWRASFIATAPFQLPRPAALEKWMRAGPEGVRTLVSDLLGDVLYGALGTVARGQRVDHVVLATRIDPVPNPESRITLTSDRDRLGLNRVQLNWRLSDLDIYSAHRMLEILGREIGRTGLGRLQNNLDGTGAVPADVHGGYHHIGTTRMADDPKHGVVDRNCRVHGMRNLYVAGSSVFPTAGAGTPTLTLVALALRLADHLKEQAL